MKILVVGGAGYIGSHTVEQLISRGYEVVVLDDFSSGNKEFIHNVKYINGNFMNSALLDDIFNTFKIESVIHFAAFTAVGESLKNPLKYYANNVQNTLILLERIIKNHIQYFIFSSSAAIFGYPNYLPIDEAHPKKPINPYGRTKLIIEEILKDYAQAYGLKSVCLRYFNVGGCHERGLFGQCHHPETHLIPLILQAANRRRPGICIFGNDYSTPDGTCIRDYVHVEDIARAHVLALEGLFEGKIESSAYNLGSGRGYSVKEIIQTVEQITHIKINVSVEPRREGDPPHLIADNKKAFQILRWMPQKSDIETIIDSAWRFELKRFGSFCQR